MRPDSKKKLVLITDSSSGDRIEIPAQNLKDSGIETYVIGLGPNVHRQNFINQLRTIASEDTENHLYLFSTYQSFSDAAINISRNLCHDATNLEKQGLQADPTNSTEPDSELTRITGRGEAYRGTVGVTASGKTSQDWAVQRSHNPPNIEPERFPDA
ncbi:von Willebrand factor A domain-containing protein 2-like [Gambusia affinis]|uniref:von Willebrand factor A domain-containing protein 2-like n=1 Tax=Gambusia affinis TaxID=33528 RepID=UPI001CDBA5B4|nr:von Willebrand factor A domain-containing protein 2-like [Gambusia affinis]